MIAGVLGQTILFDFGLFDPFGIDTVGKNVIDALAGMLSGEAAGFSGGGWGGGVERIDVIGGEKLLDGRSGQCAAVGGDVFLRAAFAFGGIDMLDRGVRVEVAGQEMRAIFLTVFGENIENCGDLALASDFVFEPRPRVEVNGCYGPLRAGQIDRGFEDTIGKFVVEQGVINGFENSTAAEDRPAMFAAFGLNKIHLEALGNSLDDGGYVCLDEDDDVGTLGFDDFSQRIGAAFTAIEDVVADESHGWMIVARLDPNANLTAKGRRDEEREEENLPQISIRRTQIKQS
jgi:hypothetical protein